ncbi:hypothetical protein DQ392_03350 [Streptomyces reniochalinae]|uniref:Uncharacterized protein n=2 Tax=Streptomyces reniochalinae TaxID=2250578 RepID=A0A367F1C2_9ACTN|nr:hypothetical protein DQ392_03350 [Streptomyces reniochalinae]
MRRWQAQEQDEVLAVTPEAVRRTVEYVLSRHFDGADEACLGPTTDALRAYLNALAEAAAVELDTGRAVVTQMVARARAAARDDGESSLTTARQTARTARDLLSLLEREGWRGSEVKTS